MRRGLEVSQMTRQISDLFVIDGEEYEGRGITDSLVNPIEFGITPMMLHTACYRGFVCRFSLDGAVRLTQLKVRSRVGTYPAIDGVLPHIDPDSKIAKYDGLALEIQYSGHLHLGRDAIPERYVHIGYAHLTEFRKVVKVTCELGVVTGITDVSAEVALQREALDKAIQADPKAGYRAMWNVEVEVVHPKKK